MTLETYAAPQNTYVDARYTEEESFDPNTGNEDPSAALLEASGAYSPSDKSITAYADTTSFEPPTDSLDPSVSMTVSDAGGQEAAAENPEEKETKSGIMTTLSTISAGMVDEVINHPLRVLGNAVLGVAIGAAAAVIIPALGVVGTGVAAAAAVTAGGIGIYQLFTHADDWLEDGEVIANADQYTAQEVAQARENLIEVGHGTTDFMAGVAGGFVGSLNSVVLKQSVEAGGKLIGDSVRTGASTASDYVAPFAKRILGAADAVMTKAGTYAGVVSNAVGSVSTPVLAKGAEVAAFVSGKVGAVAQPLADRVASATLTVGEAAAPIADKAVGMATRGADKAGQLASSGFDKVTSIAGVGADKSSQVYLTVADGARAQATRAIDFASPYVESVTNAATHLKDRAMDTASLILGKASQRADLLAQRIFADRYLASATRALSDRENVTALGYMRDFDGKVRDLVVRIADGRVFTLAAPEKAGQPFFATPALSWAENNIPRNFVAFDQTAKDAAFSSIPQDIVWSRQAKAYASLIYRMS